MPDRARRSAEDDSPEFADAASPGSLRVARVSSGERMDALAEIVDEYATTLESLLAVLRARSVGDRAARTRVTTMAVDGILRLDAASRRVRAETEVGVGTAFARVRDEVEELLRLRAVEAEFAEPPDVGCALPGEVALGARAVVRGTALALAGRVGVSRVRVTWACDDTDLLIGMRDDGRGSATPNPMRIDLVARRVHALGGRIDIVTTAGWGTDVSIAIPLHPPHVHGGGALTHDLRPREIEVLGRVAAGLRNREIAGELSISENTVKYHLTSVYRKIGVHSRAEATAFYLSHDGAPAAPPASR